MCIHAFTTDQVPKVRMAMFYTTNGMEAVGCQCYNVAPLVARIERKKKKVQFIFFLEACAHFGHDALQIAHTVATGGVTSPFSILVTIFGLFTRINRGRNLFRQWKKHNNNLKKIYENFYIQDEYNQFVQRPMCKECSNMTVEQINDSAHPARLVAASTAQIVGECAMVPVSVYFGDYFETVVTGMMESFF